MIVEHSLMMFLVCFNVLETLSTRSSYSSVGIYTNHRRNRVTAVEGADILTQVSDVTDEP
jgi:hypothetical protein